MDYFRQAVSNFLQKYFRSNQNVAPELKRLNLYLNSVHKVLSWEDPVLSWRTLGIVHLILWLILQLKLRLFSVVLILILTAFLCDVYFERIGLKESDGEPARINDMLSSTKDFFTSLQQFRKNNPRKFCVTFSGFFLCLLLLSRNISGFLLGYFIIISIFFTPLIISRIPPEYLIPIKQAIHKLTTDEGVVAESDLIPAVSEKDLDSFLTDKSQDSVSTSLMGGVASMPSHLDIEGSFDDLDEEDLEIPLKQSQRSAVSYTPGELSSDSDSEHKDIDFESAHFNGETSSSEEEEKKYTVGLKLSEGAITDVDNSSSDTIISNPNVGLLGNLVSVGQNIISTALGRREVQKQRDSESDYEIIDSDDIQ